MFSGAIGTSISGGTFTIVHNTNAYEGKAPRLLQDKVASGAFYNSSERYDPPKCHEGTREAIIKEILDWIQDLDKHEFFLWLYGPAGAGKSAIAQTIAEICSSQGLLAASFFFSRTATGRNNDTLLIPTLAYQLMISIPETCEFIFAAIDTDPLIFTRSLERQLEELILQPLSHVFSYHRIEEFNTRPRLIIVDGLDECSHPNTQHYVLTTLSSVVQRHGIPLNFLIASRPELEIREAFNRKSITALTRRLVLDDKYKPDADIKIFLTSKFAEIKDLHPLKSFLPVSWPSASDMKYLIQRSSGQFIYASTVMKFIESPRHRPTERLKIVLGLTTPGKHIPFAELDAFYLHIFASVDDIEAVKEVLSFLLLFGFPNVQKRTEFVENFFSYQSGDLQIILADLHSIISVPSPHQVFAELQLFHTSLSDFLMDKSRSGNFFIDAPNAHARLAKCCLNQTTPSNLYGLLSMRRHRPMLCTAFLRHCSNAHPNAELLQALTNFNSTTGHLFNCPPDDEDFVYVPAFFDWLDQIGDNGGLYRHYLTLYDRHLIQNLSYYPSGDLLCLMMAGLSLQISSSSHDLWKIVNFPVTTTGFEFEQVDRNRLRLLGLSNLRGSSYTAILTASFANNARRGYYKGISRDTYMALAKQGIEYCCHPELDDIDEWDDSTSQRVQGRVHTKTGRVALAIILEILLRFPGEYELAEYLSDNPKLQYMLGSEDVALVRAYMKEFPSQASENPLYEATETLDDVD